MLRFKVYCVYVYLPSELICSLGKAFSYSLAFISLIIFQNPVHLTKMTCHYCLTSILQFANKADRCIYLLSKCISSFENLLFFPLDGRNEVAFSLKPDSLCLKSQLCNPSKSLLEKLNEITNIKYEKQSLIQGKYSINVTYYEQYCISISIITFLVINDFSLVTIASEWAKDSAEFEFSSLCRKPLSMFRILNLSLVQIPKYYSNTIFNLICTIKHLSRLISAEIFKKLLCI